MPTRPVFLQPKAKIDEAEWADTQARTVKRLHDFFTPKEADSGPEPTGEADSEAGPPEDVNDEEAPGQADGPGADLAAPHELPRPIIVFSSGAAVARVLSPDVEPVPDLPGRDVKRKAMVGVFDPRPVTKKVPEARPAKKKVGQADPAAVPHCPYCAVAMDPAPITNKRCVRCRHRIVVKRVDGAAVYLTEAAVQVFEAERRRIANTTRWTRDRDRWLRLAKAVGAPTGRRAQLAAARLSDEVVAAAEKLYLTTADRAFRAARQDHDWVAAARLRRDKALALFGAAGSPIPPPPSLVAVYREGVAAELRGLSEISREAELVSGNCCEMCRAEEGLVIRIAKEQRLPRLPHAACPRGLCRCRWEIAARDRVTMRRYLRRRSGTE